MADPSPQADQQVQGSIFQEMVMQEAIKDKQAMAEAALNMQHGFDAQDYGQENQQQNQDENSDELDDDFFNDDDEKIMKSYKEQRYNQMKEEYEQR